MVNWLLLLNMSLKLPGYTHSNFFKFLKNPLIEPFITTNRINTPNSKNRIYI